MSDAHIAELARACADERFGGRGVGGNPLLYDRITWHHPPAETRSSDYIALVTIPEEPPHRQIPNGLDLVVDVLGGRCSPAPMD